MKTQSASTLFSRILAMLLLPLSFASLAHGQTIPVTAPTTAPTVTFNGAQVPRTIDASVDYAIDDSGALTFMNTGQMTGGSGAIFYATAGVYHFSATMSGANKAGSVVIDGNATSAVPSFSAAGKTGGAFYMNSSAAGGYMTIIGGTNATGVTGTLQNYWSTSSGGVVWMAAATETNLNWENLEVVNNGIAPSSGTSSASYGGVIYAASAGSKLNFKNVTFKNNANMSTSTGMGGAIYMITSVAMKGTNVAFVGNSLKAATTGAGGAIYAHTASSITLTNALFNSNTATGPVGGGAVYLQGSSTLTINSGTFSNNIVTGNVAGTAGGGAIYNNGSIVNLTDVVFTSNTTNVLGAGTQGRGGALYMGGGTTNYTVNTDITNVGNAAVAPGGTAVSGTIGGFLMYGGNNCLINFNVAAGKTLTIGSAANVQQDTFASGGANAFHVIAVNPEAGYSGTVVLHGDNSSYTSITNITKGALLLGNDQSAHSGYQVNIASGARFGGVGSLVTSGSYATLMTVDSGGIVQLGFTRLAAQTFRFSGSLALAANAVLDFGIYGGNSSDQLVITDGNIPLAPSAGVFNSTLNVTGPVVINVSALTSGSYNLINMPAGFAARSNLTPANLDASFTVTSGGSPVSPGTYTLGIDPSGNNLYLVLTSPEPPAAPDTSASTASAITPGGFTANWPAVAGATGYAIDVSTDSGFATFVTGYNGLAVTGNSLAITGLSPSTTYYYRVRAVNAVGPGANSATVTATTTAAAPATVVFHDTFGAGSTVNSTSPAAPTATSAAYQQISEKAKPSGTPVITSGTLRFGLPATTSASHQIAALFTNSPVTLTSSGDYIQLTLTFNSEGGILLDTLKNMVAVGLFNASQVPPVPGGTTANTAIADNAQNWVGYSYHFAEANSTDPTGVYTRGAQVAAASNNQGLIYRNNIAVASSMVESGLAPLTAGVPYTIDVRIVKVDAARAQIDAAIYQNSTATGTPLFTQTATNLPLNTTTFDALAFGWFTTSNVISIAGVTEITVSKGVTVPIPLPPAVPVAAPATDVSAIGFTANWAASADALGYALDVATDSTFTTFVSGYNNFNVGNNLSASLTGLVSGTTYYYRVRAVNAAGASANSATISVLVTPPVTVAPVITSVTSATTMVGSPFTYTITADNSPSGFYASGLPASLVLTASTGVISGTTVAADVGQIPIVLTATNSIGLSAPVTLALTVLPAMTEVPAITSAATATGQQDVPFSYQIAATNMAASYGVTGTLPAGVTLSGTTGLISGTPTVSGTFNVSVTATNTVGSSPAFPLAITINPPPPAITSALTASGTIGKAFNYQIVASNSPTGYAAANLPAGLVVNGTTGAITGTPATEGVSNVSLTATNVTGASPAATLVLTVVPQAAVITSQLSVSGMVGVAFNYQITASNSPTSYAAADLPAGLALNTATGAITGTPTEVGTFNVTLTATNGAGAGPSSRLVVAIAPLAVPVFTSAPSATGQIGAAFSFQLAATNGPGYTVTGLPPGFSINASGLITGTPTTPGTYVVNITAANSVASGTQQLIITIEGKTALVTLAGTAGPGGSTDGTGAAALFKAPAGAVADASGNLYIADEANNAIRRMAPNGQVTTLAITGLAAPSAVAVSPSGATLYVADSGNNQIRAVTLASGQVATLAISGLDVPSGLAVGPEGNLYIANTGACTIIKVAGGAQSILAGSAGSAGTLDGIGAGARFNLPTGLAVSADGATLYVADTANSTIRAIDVFSRQVATIAGAAQQPGTADGAPAEARFNTPEALALDAAGNLYVADTGNNTVRKIALRTNAVTTTIAGTAGVGGTDDGSGPQAKLKAPAGIAIDASGDIYIADTGNNTIRVLQTGPVIHVQPKSQSVKAGAQVKLTVVASGAPNPTYSWTRDSSTLAGGTTATYDISSAGAADAGAYTVTITNAMGSVSSVPATLTVTGTTSGGGGDTGGGGGGGGGGAPSWWMLGAFVALIALRKRK